MAIILQEAAIKILLVALSPDASDQERAEVREQLEQAAEQGAPDEIDIYRIMKASDKRRRIDMAKRVQQELFGHIPPKKGN